MIRVAENKKNEKLSLLIQTICGIGIRVSELQFITIEAVQKGEAIVDLKGKIRTILITGKLQKVLLQYTREENIRPGSIFIARTGKALDRSTI